MRILFLGLLFCDESLREAHKNSRCGVQMAPHLFQKRLTEGFNKDADIELKILNIPPIGSFPVSYKKVYSKTYKWMKNLQLGFLNLPFIKHFIQKVKIKNAVKKWLKEGEDSYIIAYSLYGPFVKVLDKLKKSYNFHASLLQTDAVPGRNSMIMSANAVKKGKRLVGYTKRFDSFIILSEYLNEPLEIGNRPSVITECVCDEKQDKAKTKQKSNNIFLYTGTTARVYGICDIVEAFKEIPNAQLWICGAGDSDEYIYKISEEYKNIHHYGYLTQAEVSKLRDECDFLINPRRPIGTYTMYSFPSKTAEYLMSEKPVLMYKLEAIPEEYNDYITYLQGSNTKEIILEIKKIMESDYFVFLEKAKEARKFMLNNKTGEKQSKKIIEMFRAFK